MSDSSKILARVRSGLIATKAPAAEIEAAAGWVEKVLDAYPAQARELGPYHHKTPTGAKIALRIASKTGVSSGRAVWTLAAMEQLAQSGAVSNSTYNPGEFGVAARVATVARRATGTAKAAAREIVPEAVQRAASSAIEGSVATVEGTGILLKALPFLALAGAGLYAWSMVKRARR